MNTYFFPLNMNISIKLKSHENNNMNIILFKLGALSAIFISYLKVLYNVFWFHSLSCHNLLHSPPFPTHLTLCLLFCLFHLISSSPICASHVLWDVWPSIMACWAHQKHILKEKYLSFSQEQSAVWSVSAKGWTARALAFFLLCFHLPWACIVFSAQSATTTVDSSYEQLPCFFSLLNIKNQS